MNPNINNIKRQIEIIGLTLKEPEKYKKVDLSEMFDVSESTIDGDFKYLRRMGVEIRFKKKRGAYIEKPIPKQILKYLVLQYFGLLNANTQFDRATNLFVEKFNQESIMHLVTLERAIEEKIAVKMEYQKEGDEIKERLVYPILLFQRQGYYRLLAKNNGEIKQFHLMKIRSIKRTTLPSTKISESDIQSMFENSLEAWLSKDTYKVKLLFNTEWSKFLLPTVLIENQILKDNGNGSYTVEVTVNRLEELAYWIAPRGEGVYVVEPKELRDLVVKFAQGTIDSYKKFKS